MADPSGDTELMRRTAAGDVAAFRQLVSAHLPRVHAVAYRLLLSREDAEEAAQAAFTKVWRQAGRFDPAKAAFTTWLYTVVTRACLDRMRRLKPSALPIEDWQDRLSDDAPDAAGQLESRQDALAVRNAVAALPPNQRAAIVLSYFEGLSNAEAAQGLGVSVGALESLLVRARRQLKTMLGTPDD